MNSQAQDAALEDLSGAPNYQNWLASLAAPFFGAKVLELGSGNGDYAQIWLKKGVQDVTLSEVDPGRLTQLRNRFHSEPKVTVVDVDGALSGGARFNTLASFNVLEHVEDPVSLLSRARKVLFPGASVLTFVPAFPFAMSDFDRSIGHYRRYTRHSLADQLTQSGLIIESIRYINMPGLLAWTVGMKFLRMRPGQGPFLKVWDRFVIPTTRKIERNRSVPFGQSVWAVARNPE